MIVVWLVMLVVAVFVLVGVAYRGGDGELASPAFLFCLGFVPSLLCALLMSDVWKVELQAVTVLVIAGSLALFLIACLLAHRYSHKLAAAGVVGSHLRRPEVMGLPARTIPLFIALAMQFAVFIAVLSQIQGWYPDSSLTMALGYYKESRTFTTENLSFGFPLKQLVNLCKGAGYLFSYMFAEQVLAKNPKGLALTGANLAVSSALGFVTGGRFLGLGYIVCTVICVLILRGRQGLPSVSKKGVVIVVACGAVFIALFQFLSFGRSGSIPFAEYASLYLGAPVANLNSFLQEGDFGGSVPFGRMTFYCWYTYLGYKLGIVDWQYTFDLPYRQSNGYDLGNVYTTFYSFIYDFGYIGLVVLVVVMAVISQFVYEGAKTHSGKAFDLWVIASAFIGYQLLFSFFSDKFYEEILTPGFITTGIYLLFARLLLCQLDKGMVERMLPPLRRIV